MTAWKQTRRLNALVLAALVCLSAAACSKKGDDRGSTDRTAESMPFGGEMGGMPFPGGEGETNEPPVELGELSELDLKYTETDLNAACDNPTATVVCDGGSAAIEGEGVGFSDGKLTVTSAGCYLLSGSFKGQVLVNAADTDKVQLVLDGFSVTYGEGSPILCENADKLVVTLAEGSENRVNDTGSGYIDAEEGEEDPNTRTGGAIHAKCALTLNGEGTLEVESGYHHGIFSKKTLKIVSGNISVTAPGDALKGKNAVAVREGVLTLDAGGDGIQCSETDDLTKGYIAVEGGKLTVRAEGDGLDASLYLLLRGGEIDVTTTGTERKLYEESTSTESGGKGMTPPGGFGGGFGGGGMMGGGSYSQDGYEVNSDGYYKITSKGLKSGGLIEITGGKTKVVSTGHSVKSDGDIRVGGEDTSLDLTAYCETYRANSKGLSADGTLTIAGGEVTVHYAYEGIEAAGGITLSGGRARVLEAVDDGVNVGSAGQTVAVSGGSLFVNASGDGIDSNGNLEISGGIVIVAGPTNSGNGALDHGDGNYGILVSGGTLIAYGASGMAESPSVSSTQCSISYNTSLQSGDILSVKDGEGKTVVAVKLLKNAQNIVISSPELTEGESYTLCTGGSADEVNEDGLVIGSVSGGSEIAELTLSSTVTSNGGPMGGGFGGGGFGGSGGGMDLPDGGMGGHGGRP